MSVDDFPCCAPAGDPFTTAQPGPLPVPARPHRAYWLPDGTWVDPDCRECGGEGAPCCDPPYLPAELDRLRGQQAYLLALCDDTERWLNGLTADDLVDRPHVVPIDAIRRALGVTS